jgi:D-amino peptidase
VKIFMHWDMEGVSGLFTREHVWFWEPETSARVAEEGRRLLQADINAAVAAALEAGADELIVCDTHHGGGNIRLEEMLSDPRVKYLVRSRAQEGTKTRWMPGLEGCDGLMLMGHHAKAGTPGAFLPHTWMLEWEDFRINGQSVGEIGIEACYAGHFDVPPVLVQGEETGCREAEALLPGVVTAVVKRAVSRDLCTGPDAEGARRLTAGKVVEAIAAARSRRLKPYKPRLPMTVTIRMRKAESAAAAGEKPNVKRTDERTVEARVERHCDVVKWIVNTGLE